MMVIALVFSVSSSVMDAYPIALVVEPISASASLITAVAFSLSIAEIEPVKQNASFEVSFSTCKDATVLLITFMLAVIQVFPPNTTLPSKLTITKVPTNQTQVGRPLEFFFGSCGGCSVIGYLFLGLFPSLINKGKIGGSIPTQIIILPLVNFR